MIRLGEPSCLRVFVAKKFGSSLRSDFFFLTFSKIIIINAAFGSLIFEKERLSINCVESSGLDQLKLNSAGTTEQKKTTPFPNVCS